MGRVKKKSLLTKFSFILIGIWLFYLSGCTKSKEVVGEYGIDWKLYGESEISTGYYNARNISDSSKGIVKVWVEYDYKRQGIEMVINKAVMGGVSSKKIENLRFMKNLCEIDCQNRRVRILKNIVYDKEGNFLYQSSLGTEYINIPTNTMYNNLHKAVCP